MVASNQPFTEVENVFLHRLLQYLHSRRSLTIPSADTIKRRAMDMGKDVVLQLKEFIVVCISLYLPTSWTLMFLRQSLKVMVTLSLDLWSSSNGHAFQAVVMHYISNNWTIGKLVFTYHGKILMYVQRKYWLTSVSFMAHILAKIWPKLCGRQWAS